jgi:hypothetical protein
MAVFEAELVNKFSKYIKTIENRVVEVEFYWFQVSPYQTYRLRINENQFHEAQKHIHSKSRIFLFSQIHFFVCFLKNYWI